MKITKDCIFGNIGYVIDLQGVKWILIGFDWDNRAYICQNFYDRSWIVKMHIDDLIGADIVKDYWEKVKNGKI